jgi:hypothetical protein
MFEGDLISVEVSLGMLKNKWLIKEESAALDGPFFLLGNPADARPAVLFDGGEVLHAVEVGREILSLFLGGLFTDWVGFVDIVDASDFKVVGAVSSGSESEEGSNGDEEFHVNYKLLLRYN